MGSVIENAKTKEKCQIFTPDDIVETMLDHVGYIDSLYGKTILENSKINVVDSEGFIDPCTEEYDKHLIRLPDGSISGITPLGKYMRKTLQLYLKRHEIIHNLDKLKRKRDELKNSVAKDKLQGKECRKKEAALQLITESFFEYFNLWEKISQESA